MMFRYLATRAAHEKNPYPAGTPEWQSYNSGFIGQAIPTIPSRWEFLMTLIYLTPVIAVLILFAVFSHQQ